VSAAQNLVHSAKRVLPLWLRRELRRRVTQAKIRGAIRQAGPVVPTAVPLPPNLVAAIEACRAALAGNPSRHAAFPDSEELLAYWDRLLDVVSALRQANRPDDKYFDTDRLEQRRRAGETNLKDLFAMWLAATAGPASILEIGCRTGRSIALQLSSHRSPGQCLAVLIDPFVEMGSPNVVLANLERLGLPTGSVFPLVGTSETLVPAVVQALPELRFDYVLVDGSHVAAEALADLRGVTGLVAPGGYVVFDDIGPETYGLLPTWETWSERLRDRFDFRVYDAPQAFAVARRRRL
jgi:predicted O-methyltransferase YrrM